MPSTIYYDTAYFFYIIVHNNLRNSFFGMAHNL